MHADMRKYVDIVVPGAGVEPARDNPRDFKSGCRNFSKTPGQGADSWPGVLHGGVAVSCAELRDLASSQAQF